MSAAIRNGHVYLARKILASPLWKLVPEVRVTAITSIVLANHEEGHVPSPQGRGLYPVQRGQFIRCWKNFSDECWINIQQVRTAVSELEQAHFLRRESFPKFSRYTVLNYNDYQSRENYGAGKRIEDGYVLIARKIVKSELWTRTADVRIVAVTSLLMANFLPGMYADENREIEVAPGTFISTPERIAERANLDLPLVERALRILQGLEFMTRTSQEGGLFLFSIPNYDIYQDASNYQRFSDLETEKKLRKCKDPERPDSKDVTHLQQDGNKKPTRTNNCDSTEKISLDGSATERSGSQDVAVAEQDANRTLTRSQQDPNKTVTRSQQDLNKTPTRNKNAVKKDEEGREGEEGGKTHAPPPAPAGNDLDLWGAPPPLPPEEQIANAYRKKFSDMMSQEKARKQAVLFLRKGGKLNEALAAINTTPESPAVVIWKILDPLLSGSSSPPKSGAASWIPPSQR